MQAVVASSASPSALLAAGSAAGGEVVSGNRHGSSEAESVVSSSYTPTVTAGIRTRRRRRARCGLAGGGAGSSDSAVCSPNQASNDGASPNAEEPQKSVAPAVGHRAAAEGPSGFSAAEEVDKIKVKDEVIEATTTTRPVVECATERLSQRRTRRSLRLLEMASLSSTSRADESLTNLPSQCDGVQLAEPIDQPDTTALSPSPAGSTSRRRRGSRAEKLIKLSRSASSESPEPEERNGQGKVKDEATCKAFPKHEPRRRDPPPAEPRRSSRRRPSRPPSVDATIPPLSHLLGLSVLEDSRLSWSDGETDPSQSTNFHRQNISNESQDDPGTPPTPSALASPASSSVPSSTDIQSEGAAIPPHPNGNPLAVAPGSADIPVYLALHERQEVSEGRCALVEPPPKPAPLPLTPKRFVKARKRSTRRSTTATEVSVPSSSVPVHPTKSNGGADSEPQPTAPAVERADNAESASMDPVVTDISVGVNVNHEHEAEKQASHDAAPTAESAVGGSREPFACGALFRVKVHPAVAAAREMAALGLAGEGGGDEDGGDTGKEVVTWCSGRKANPHFRRCASSVEQQSSRAGNLLVAWREVSRKFSRLSESQTTCRPARNPREPGGVSLDNFKTVLSEPSDLREEPENEGSTSDAAHLLLLLHDEEGSSSSPAGEPIVYCSSLADEDPSADPISSESCWLGSSLTDCPSAAAAAAAAEYSPPEVFGQRGRTRVTVKVEASAAFVKPIATVDGANGEVLGGGGGYETTASASGFALLSQSVQSRTADLHFHPVAYLRSVPVIWLRVQSSACPPVWGLAGRSFPFTSFNVRLTLLWIPDAFSAEQRDVCVSNDSAVSEEEASEGRLSLEAFVSANHFDILDSRRVNSPLEKRFRKHVTRRLRRHASKSTVRDADRIVAPAPAPPHYSHQQRHQPHEHHHNVHQGLHHLPMAAPSPYHQHSVPIAPPWWPQSQDPHRSLPPFPSAPWPSPSAVAPSTAPPAGRALDSFLPEMFTESPPESGDTTPQAPRPTHDHSSQHPAAAAPDPSRSPAAARAVRRAPPPRSGSTRSLPDEGSTTWQPLPPPQQHTSSSGTATRATLSQPSIGASAVQHQQHYQRSDIHFAESPSHGHMISGGWMKTEVSQQHSGMYNMGATMHNHPRHHLTAPQSSTSSNFGYSMQPHHTTALAATGEAWQQQQRFLGGAGHGGAGYSETGQSSRLVNFRGWGLEGASTSASSSSSEEESSDETDSTPPMLEPLDLSDCETEIPSSATLTGFRGSSDWRSAAEFGALGEYSSARQLTRRERRNILCGFRRVASHFRSARVMSKVLSRKYKRSRRGCGGLVKQETLLCSAPPLWRNAARLLLSMWRDLSVSEKLVSEIDGASFSASLCESGALRARTSPFRRNELICWQSDPRDLAGSTKKPSIPLLLRNFVKGGELPKVLKVIRGHLVEPPPDIPNNDRFPLTASAENGKTTSVDDEECDDILSNPKQTLISFEHLPVFLLVNADRLHLDNGSQCSASPLRVPSLEFNFLLVSRDGDRVPSTPPRNPEFSVGIKLFSTRHPEPSHEYCAWPWVDPAAEAEVRPRIFRCGGGESCGGDGGGGESCGGDGGGEDR